MRSPIFILVIIAATLSGCGSSSVERIDENISSPDFAAQRSTTRVHLSSETTSSRHIAAHPGQPTHLHIHTSGSACIDVVTAER